MGKIKFALLGLLVAVVALGLSRISFNVDILKLLPGNLKQVQGLGIFLKHFALPNELIVTIEGSDANAVDTAATAIAAHLRAHSDLVSTAVEAAPWESDPKQLSELIAYLLLNQPPEKAAALAGRLSAAQAPAIARATLDKLGDSLAPEDIAMLGYDPYGLSDSLLHSNLIPDDMKSEFSSADGTFRVVYVESAVPIENYETAIEWIAKIKVLAAASVPDQTVKLGFTGQPAFVADISGTMKRDMISSCVATLIVIGIIFWLCYRRLKPLLDLILMLVIIFIISMGLAGLFLHQLTIMGVGFASIMIGLSVDYGYLIYQKSLHHRGTLRELQWDSFQSILWTAGTTSAAFFALNLSSLPGLSQLGNLVGIGMIVGAAVMILVFTRIALRWKKAPPPPTFVERAFLSQAFLRRGAWMAAALVILLGAVVVVKGPPKIDASASTLRPRHSGAYDAMDQLYARLADDRDMLSLLVTGSSEAEVFARLQTATAKLQAAQNRGEVQSFHSALPLWPNPANQQANLATLAPLAHEAPRLAQTLADIGFNPEAFGLTGAVLDQWATWAKENPPIWPGNPASQWIMRRAVSRTDGEAVASGIVRAVPGHEDQVVEEIQTDGVYLVSWGELGSELRRVVPGEFLRLIVGLVGIVLVLLWIGFRSFRDVGLLVLTMALVFTALTGAMSLLGLDWNYFNLAAMLLLMGTGIDYSILFLLALRRNGGDVSEAQRTIGLVVALCAAAATAGFGTIGWANNRGLASLGTTCALGLALDAVITIFLLPVGWRLIHGRPASPTESPAGSGRSRE